MKTNYIPEELKRLRREKWESLRHGNSVPLVQKMRITRYPITEVDRKTEEVRRNTPAHSVESCGGCAGYYNPKEWVVKGRDRKGREKSVSLTEEFVTHYNGAEERGAPQVYLTPISRLGAAV
tara:strand:+ start:351 stop:716 length:366 start_codon:yes stop_codon:yes gene_type:complete